MTVGVLVNGNARRHRRNPRLADRYTALGARVIQTKDLDELDAAVQSLQDAAVHTVALSGGDGAVHRGLSALARSWSGPMPRIAVLPAGTMNTVARGLGIRGGPEAVLSRALNPNSVVIQRRPIDAGESRLGFLVGTGFWARFLQAYDARSGPGPLRAAGVLMRGLASTAVGGRFVSDLFQPVVARVCLDDQPIVAQQFTMVAAGAVPSVGLGFAPFSSAVGQANTFHALAFQSPPARVAVQLPRLFRGGAPTQPDRGQAATSLTMQADVPFVWAMDGDVQPPTTALSLTVGPLLSVVQ